MKKEFAWAIAIGIIFGLVVAFGIWKVNQSLKNTPKIAVEKTSTPSPTNTTLATKITFRSPTNESISSAQELKITGITKPSTQIVISGIAEDYLTTSNTDGSFEMDINLVSGINTIKASLVDSSSPQITASLIVIYSSSYEDLEATESASINPKAFIGTVTDVTDLNLQLKTDKNEIKQIATTEDSTGVINIKETPNKTLKIEDVAIGDYIAALGPVNTNGVLAAKRILVTSPSEKTDLTVTKTNYSNDLDTDKNTTFYQYSDGATTNIKESEIEDEAEIIYIQNGDIIRTVFVLATQ